GAFTGSAARDPVGGDRAQLSEADDHGAADVATEGVMGVGVAGADPKEIDLAGRLLLGRDRELERLFGMIDGIGRRGGALVIRGEAGIGKSALLEAVGERALGQGATGVTTAGAPPETRVALGGVHKRARARRCRLSRRHVS